MKPLHLVEIGCDRVASLQNMLTPEGRLEIFECNPNHLFEIDKYYQGYSNVTVYPYAMWKENGKVKFHLEGASSYVSGLPSPCVLNDNIQPNEEWTIEVEAKTFDQFDDGTIDVMDIDIEGAEWYVIERMKSRPRAIFIEMEWDKYRNPHFSEIQKWMKDNYYYKAEVCGASHCYMRII
jgi:FkbM family methyltransferase